MAACNDLAALVRPADQSACSLRVSSRVGRPGDASTRLRAEEWFFQVIARHHRWAEPAGCDGAVQGCQVIRQQPRRCSNGGQALRDPALPHRLESMVKGVGGHLNGIEIDPCKPVHLQIEQPACYHAAAVMRTRGRVNRVRSGGVAVERR